MLIHLRALGCRLNEAELEIWAQSFQKAGHQISPELHHANVIILNSCAVTQEAARKSRQLIRRLHHQNPTAKLVVSGCYATLNETEVAQLLGVDLVISNADKSQLVEKTLSELNFDTMPAMSTEAGAHSLFTRGRQRAFVKVQDGCRYRCTFCIVTIARGEEVSRPLTAIIDEINQLHQQGINEVILTGVHLGGYGTEIQLDLSTLIESILQETTILRLRLGSLEPWDLPDDFFNLFQNPRLMPHLHLPLQSGCDRVLKRMARRCKTQEFADIVTKARQKNADFNITTDIIVGFPDESEEEWQQSFDFIKKIGFGGIHIFSYSHREGTKAATLANPIRKEIKKQRSKQLHQLAAVMKQQFIETQLNKQVSVLWETPQTDSLTGNLLNVGYTPNYLRVACEHSLDNPLENTLSSVTLKTIAPNYIHA
ncbi:MAG: tRNA (N(6)-L-threonylcarbamoyladenosine(37)-C(2))-methylthiotransferase MtaB [Methylococcales bacterium]|nr:tRNA (N(6)-L-threonylcarbamoyladenosine(37)-C(2))-methylthiotransferase MtaB [Methylococcales bacterium]